MDILSELYKVQGTMESMSAQFSSGLASFEARAANLAGDVHSPPSPDLASLAADYSSFKSYIQDTVKLIKSQVDLLIRAMDDIETRSRQKVLLFHGVEESQKESVQDVVSALVVNKIHLDDFSKDMISSSHRLGVYNPKARNPRPILVCFREYEVRSKIWHQKTHLKGSSVTVSEFLTKSRHRIFVEARKKIDIRRCWTQEGRVVVLLPGGDRKKVDTLTTLAQIIKDNPDILRKDPAVVPTTDSKTAHKEKAAKDPKTRAQKELAMKNSK